MSSAEKLDIVQLEMAADKIRVVAHPLRLAILELLEPDKKMNVTQIREKLNIGQATASHHLNILKSKDILQSCREGRRTYYYIKQKTLARLIICINRCNETD